MEKSGFITAIVLGLVFLIMMVIISFTIIQNLSNISTSIDSGAATAKAINETGGFANNSGYTLDQVALATGFNSPVILELFNATDDTSVDLANVTVDSSTGIVTNATPLTWEALLITYNYDYKESQTTVETLQSNLTTGITNVSNKLPTIFLVAAIVIILGILAILWGQFKGMSIGGSEGSI